MSYLFLVRRLALVLVAVLVFAACGNDDDGGADASTTTGGVTEEPGGDEVLDDVVFDSDDFVDGGELPVEITCDGDGRSPALSWSGFPDDTEEVAVIVDDPDAPGGSFIHWAIWGIDVGADLGAGDVPGSAVEGANDAGGTGWTGPCPPEGDGPHHYVFSLFSVPGSIDLAAGAPAIEPLDFGGIEVATITGTYER